MDVMELSQISTGSDYIETLLLYSGISLLFLLLITKKFIPQGKNRKTCFVIAIEEKVFCFDRNVTSERKN